MCGRSSSRRGACRSPNTPPTTSSLTCSGRKRTVHTIFLLSRHNINYDSLHRQHIVELRKNGKTGIFSSIFPISLGLQDRLQIYHIDVMKDPEAVLRLCSPVSALVSNPPYLFSEDMLSLEPEILRFEDPSALDGGQDGLDVIRQILTMAPKVLSDHGRAYLEVDPRHPRLIRRWVEANVEELRYVETRHDITGRPRFCILQKRDIRKGP
ncbi:hypothetical protein F2P81_012565 [Scophthalmus maximus]|uniref:HemK methyltransferase family member 1 n=1 Tax=Scophthalmus maximus TaxID=52904 RepID=A0A6A4SNK3_SCOMX|nr:hypothetical protein F2P81_012565 [Scophthalmus maximus]